MGKVRLELVADFGPRRGHTFSGVVVEPEYDAILRAGLNKLKLRKKDGLLLVLKDQYLGAKLLSPTADLRVLLRDGVTVVLTTQRPQVRVPRPPRWPWPLLWSGSAAGPTDARDDNADEVASPGSETLPDVAARPEPEALLTAPAHARQAVVTSSAAAEEQCDLGDWCGSWPVLKGNALPLVRRAIAQVPGFLERAMDGYISFDYNACSANQLPAMFPDPQSLPKKGDARLLAAVRRECRGLLLCAETGAVLARRLPKFFNVDEVDETQFARLPPGGLATEKLDGSLVSPVLLDGVLRWASKSARMHAIEEFTAGSKLAEIAYGLLKQGCTPIFEWCDTGPPVAVISHPERRLVLLAVRHCVTGEFWHDSRVRELGCDVAEAVHFDDLTQLLDATRKTVSKEGVVVAWPERGLFVKFKSTWWVSLAAAQRKGSRHPALALHSALQGVSLGSIPPALVWQAVLAGDDDQLSMVYGELASAAQALRAFAAAVEVGVRALDNELREWAESAREASEADLAGGGWPLAVLVAYQRRAPAAERGLRKFLSKMAVAGELPGLESLLGTVWDGSRQTVEVCCHLGTFEEAPGDVAAHVLDEYLPRKVADYLGCGAVSEDTIVRVPRLHEPSEGKIKGLWERFADAGIIDLRVDLQPRGKVFDFHGGDADFAHWQVQFGPNDSCPRSTKAKSGDRRGAFAGVLLRTDVDVAFVQLRDAFALSFKTRKVVRYDPSPFKISHIYVDLDGVLADFHAGFDKDFGSVPEAKAKWQYIERTPGFYDSLPWMEGAKKVWDHVCKTGLLVSILTGIPEGPLGNRSAEEKAKWVARELGRDVEIITCLSKDKPSYSGQGKLLIDDRLQKGWEQVGGRQIVHRAVPETLLAMTELGLGLPFAASRETVAVVDRLTEDLKISRANAEEVALDVEWQPDRAGARQNQAALLQLAFRPAGKWAAFVLDVIAWDPELEEFVRELLASDLPKRVFGPGDADRLQMRLVAATDMQETSDSLAVHARRAGLVLMQLQAADWSARPLRDEQVLYAATDALVLLELPGGQAAKKARLAHAGGRPATVEYVGVFLSPQARKKLLQRAPPRFGEVRADHMTLSWHPESVNGLGVGTSVKLRVEGAGCEEGVQAVSVTTVEAQPRGGHITISHKPDVAAVESRRLPFEPLEESFFLDGIIGVGVILGGADEDQLPVAILSRLHALAAAQPGQSERFERLTDSQRYALHLAADELGLEHRSEGRKGTVQRKLVITVPKRLRKVEKDQSGERTVVKDARKFAALFGDVPGLKLHGRLTRSGVEWQAGVVLQPALERLLQSSEDSHPESRICVILRGFPGSGKSTLSAIFRRHVSLDVASADDFYTDTQHIHDAHEQCRQAFAQALNAGRSVIVDNTNVRKSDYTFYRTRAEAMGYAVAVLEIVCDSTGELEELRRRSVHGVPGEAVGLMWQRWEHDPTALRLAPHVPSDLMRWLRESNMLERTPRTHLRMPAGPFVSVQPAARAEFHERFQSEWGRHYISEQASPQAFRLFFDIDGLTIDRLRPALRSLLAIVGAPMVITGTTEPPEPGYHVFVPSRVVDSASALALRRRWLEVEPELENYVDAQVYKSPQLRLVGSRKISKDSIDSGRVHEVVGRFDGEWFAEPPWKWSDVTILADWP